VGVGLSAVAFGSAWAAGGGHAVHVLWHDAGVAVPTALVLLGLWLLLRAAVPAGQLAVPVLLVASGMVLLLAWTGTPWGISSTRVSQYSIIAGGVLVAMLRPRERIRVKTGVERFGTPIGKRPPNQITDTASPKYIVRVFAGAHMHLDLTRAQYPLEAERIVIDATVLGGRLTVSVPSTWTLQPGRIDLAYGIIPDGDFSTDVPAAPGASREDDEYPVVLNLQGLGGRVSLRSV
jgi:hypothetical protein